MSLLVSYARVLHRWLRSCFFLSLIFGIAPTIRIWRKTHRSDKRAQTNIIVIRNDGIGDLVLTTPFLQELRGAFPGAHITIVISPITSSLLEGCPFVDRVLIYEPVRVDWQSWCAIYNAWQFARTNLSDVDWSFALLPRWDEDYFQSTLIAFFSRAHARIGISEQVRFRFVSRGLDRLLTKSISNCTTGHEAYRPNAILKALGIQPQGTQPNLWVSKEEQRWALTWLHGTKRHEPSKLIALAPGAGHSRREWPIKCYLEVGRRIAELGYYILILGGKNDRHLGSYLAEDACQNTIDVTGRLNLRQAAALLENCALYIGGDTGMMHIAAAVGVPVVEISCHPLSGDKSHERSPDRFGPINTDYFIVRPEKAMPPCHRTCKAPNAHCIRQIEASEVLNAALALLGPENENTGFPNNQIVS